jgi:hypothetical protein
VTGSVNGAENPLFRASTTVPPGARTYTVFVSRSITGVTSASIPRSAARRTRELVLVHVAGKLLASPWIVEPIVNVGAPIPARDSRCTHPLG